MSEQEQAQDEKLTPEEEQFVDEMLDDMLEGVADGFLNQGLTTGQMAGITEEEYEALYTLGFNKYNDKDYEGAVQVFTHLCQLNPLEAKYMRSLGSALQMCKRYQEALDAYGATLAIDLEDAEASLHAGECMMLLGRLDEARQAFEGCEIQCNEDPEKYKDVAARAKSLLEQVNSRNGDEGES